MFGAVPTLPHTSAWRLASMSRGTDIYLPLPKCVTPCWKSHIPKHVTETAGKVTDCGVQIAVVTVQQYLAQRVTKLHLK